MSDLEWVKEEYISQQNSTIADRFLTPCLLHAEKYQRETGYFQSSALISWAPALERLVKGDFKGIELIGSPNVSTSDKQTLLDHANHTIAQEILDKGINSIIQDICDFIENDEDRKLQSEIFAWLIANERLKLKFAFWYPIAKDVGLEFFEKLERERLYHPKTGIISFNDGRKIAFHGSMNETLNGHSLSYEQIDVYCSWKENDAQRVKNKINEFEKQWFGRIDGLEVKEPDEDTLKRLIERAPENINPLIKKLNKKKVNNKWKHQDEAVNFFLKHSHGILEMATGTGKTRTSIKIFNELVKNYNCNSIIVTMDGTDLLKQWFEDLEDWVLNENNNGWKIFREFENFREANDYYLAHNNSIMLISREHGLPKLLKVLEHDKRSHSIIIHDEVHGLGSPGNQKNLAGQHKHFKWTLGLSATPDREYDDIGTQFIEDEIGKEKFQFGLKEAIEKGVLCEFDYVPIEYERTDNDRERIKRIYSAYQASIKNGNPWPKKELAIRLSNIDKTAEQKPKIFADFITDDLGPIKNSIIFVETTEFGSEFLPIIQKFTTRYHTYYGPDSKDNLTKFSKGELDVLVTCHKISQGIDIRRLEKVVLVSSAGARLETIQRIGRCLRTSDDNPRKRATVYDFVRVQENEEEEEENADQKRQTWLEELSKVRYVG